MKEKKQILSRIPFNLLDVLIILLVLICLVGVWQRNNLRSLFADNEELEDYVVVFEIKKIRTSSATLLKKDTNFTIEQEDKMISLGSVSEISGSVATEKMVNADGETVDAAYPVDTYYDVRGQLICRGIKNNGAFLLGGKYYLAKGQTVIAYSENADFQLTIIDITEAT